MTAPIERLAAAIDLLHRYEALSPAEKNYRSVMWAGLLAATVRDLAEAVAGPGGGAIGEAFSHGQDRFAYETAQLISDLGNSGHDPACVLRSVQEMIAARIEVSLPEEEWFTG